MNNPIESFMKLGEKVTKGDPKKLMDWNFYMMLIMFIAFFVILIDNLVIFFQTQRFYSLGWSFVVLAILWFQYQGLSQTYFARKMFKKQKTEKIETIEEMLKEFKGK